MGSLEESAQSFAQSATAYEGMGDIRMWAGSTSCRFYAVYQRADFASAAQLASDLVRVGENAGDPHIVSWGREALGVLGLAIGPLDKAASHLTAFRDLCIQISDFRRRTGAEGFLGKCRLRQGRLKEAAVVIRMAMDLIAATNLRGRWTSEPHHTIAEFCLIEASRVPDTRRREAIRTASRACVKALQCAPAWRPEALRLHGTLAWLSGDTTSARARWQQSLETAEKLRLPVERARTLLEMGDRLADVALVDEATRVFAQTGAKVYLGFSLHARARLARALSADGGSTLQRYDQAIAALDEVKAEYALGVACRQRAHLHKQCGRLDQARADLVQARRCFAAVGAPEEQADVEQEASTLGEKDGSA
jgi:tetratricopeptide (TPR) repeat protein